MSRPNGPPIVAKHVIRAMETAIGPLPAEQGGVLGRDRETGVIDHFHFDISAERSSATYSPDTAAMARLFTAWDRSGVRLAGFGHSHPPAVKRPSTGDVVYAERILDRNPKLETLELPIVMTEADTGTFDILWWRAIRNGSAPLRIERTDPVVVGDEPPTPPSAQSEQTSNPQLPLVRVALPNELWLADGTFARVESAYDLARLATARVVIFGTGGAQGFVEDLARAGVGEFVLVDFDTVSLSNLATQQAYRRDALRPKVQCLAERIKDINPDAVVVCVQKPVEALPDDLIYRLAFGYSRVYKNLPATVRAGSSSLSIPIDVRMRPSITVFMGMTDDFHAQARVSRLALKFGLPCLLAQVYREGRGLEVVFSYPGVTPACPRCVLKPRYDAYLHDNFHNDVTSAGTPIFATTRLNALKGFITMAILHHGSPHPRWGTLLQRIANRNLIQVRCDPDFDLRTFETAFRNADPNMIFMDESVFVRRHPVPDCQDCNGTGDLRACIGRSHDTRLVA